MKNKPFVFLTVVLLVSLLPVAALAAKPAQIRVDVRNQTGAPVDLSLTDTAGNITYQDLPAGNSSFDLTEGKYTYFAATQCGNQSGPFNANVTKVLYLECDGAPVVMYEKCQFVGYSPYIQQLYDPGVMYRTMQGYGYPYSYEYYLWSYGLGENYYKCIYGLQAEDYWGGEKPADTKPVWMR